MDQLHYAISLLQMKKIIQDADTFLLPGLPRAVSSVLVDEEQLVPVLDLGLLCGATSMAERKASTYQVLVESEYGVVALPATLDSKIVSEKKGILSRPTESKTSWITREFTYQNIKYKILDINFLAVELTQNFWRDQSDTSGARRH